MKHINLFFLFFFINIILCSSLIFAEDKPLLPAGAIPLLPMTIIGQSSTVNGQLCTANTIIESIIDGKIRATRNCNELGKYTIAIVGDNLDNGKEILFIVDGIQLLQKETWSSGKIVSNFSFAITRELNAKELQAIAQVEQNKKYQENKIAEKKLQQQKEQKQQKIIFIISIIIFVIIMIVIIYFLIKRKNNNKLQHKLQDKLQKTKKITVKKQKNK